MSIILCWLLLCVPLITAFSFTPGNPTECDSLPITWTGGVAPFFLHVIRVFGTPINITIPPAAFTNGKGSYSVPQLQVASQTQILLSMSDATGFATGGTTNLLTVGASKGGNSCNSKDPGVNFSFELNDPLVQCQPYTFSGYDGARQPVTIYGIIPSGTPFVLSPPNGATEFPWIADVEHGTSIVFMMTDSLGNQGGSSHVETVANSNDQSCLSGSSPSSTSASPTTTQSQSNKGPTGSSSGPSSTSSSPASSGGSSAGAIAGAVIGALLFVAVVVTLSIFFLKKRKEAQAATSGTSTTGFPPYPPYSGGHTNDYSLSSTANAMYGAAAAHTPYTPYSPQAHNPHNPYGSEPPYGHTYQPSQYAPSTYAPSAQMHNHTLSGGAPGAHDAYQGSMLPYDANPFLDNPYQSQPYPPANYAHQSTYQLPSASAYALPHPNDPFNPPLVGRGQPQAQPQPQPQPPLPPPPGTEDPFNVSEAASTSETKASSQQRKGGTSEYGPSRILVHTDADDVLPPPNAQGVVELPPQYTERRRGGGLTVVNQSPPSPDSEPSPVTPQHQLPSSST